jgi:hypothetical protein
MAAADSPVQTVVCYVGSGEGLLLQILNRQRRSYRCL